MNLEKSILATLTYFDLFNYPLTSSEIQKNLYQGLVISLAKLEKFLENNLGGQIESREGFFFLPGRSELVEIRLRRYCLAQEKFKKALRASRLLKHLPFIKMIAVCNSLGYSNARVESDIDLFIITASGRIWLARFLVVGLAKIFSWRPSFAAGRDKICFSFFISDNNLDLTTLKIAPWDIYLTYWLNQLVPLYNLEGIYEKFITANLWTQRILPNNFIYQTGPRRSLSQRSLIKKIGEKVLGIFGENFFRWLQLKILPTRLKELVNKDTCVVMNNQILKFHANDRRAEYQRRFNERLRFLNG